MDRPTGTLLGFGADEWYKQLMYALHLRIHVKPRYTLYMYACKVCCHFDLVGFPVISTDFMVSLSLYAGTGIELAGSIVQ